MELGQSVFRWGVFLPYRFFGVDSFHLRGGSSFWSFFSFWGCSRLVYSLYALWRLAFSNAYLVYLSKKKKMKILTHTFMVSGMNCLCILGLQLFWDILLYTAMLHQQPFFGLMNLRFQWRWWVVQYVKIELVRMVVSVKG